MNAGNFDKKIILPTDSGLLQKLAPINNEYGHFQNELLKELAESKAISNEIQFDQADMISEIQKETEGNYNVNANQNNINIQILGSIQSGYGFLPNFSHPNNQGSNRVRRRLSTFSPPSMNFKALDFNFNKMRVTARSPEMANTVEMSLGPIKTKDRKQSLSVMRDKSSPMYKEPRQQVSVVGETKEEEESRLSNMGDIQGTFDLGIDEAKNKSSHGSQ